MYKFLKLKNGISVGLFKMDEVKSIALKSLVVAGPVIETKENNGISHFIEHILFDGIKSHPNKAEFANHMEELGVSYNGYTSTQELGLEFDLPYTSLMQTLGVLKEMLFEPIFSDAIVEQERKVILEEMKDRSNEPSYKFYFKCVELRFKEKEFPLSRKVIGTPEVISNLSRNELLDMYRKIFIPSNLNLSIVGNFDMNEVENELNRLFGDIENTGSLEKVVFSNDDLSSYTVFSQEDEKFNNVYTSISFPSFPRETPIFERLTVGLFNTMLTGARTSRLWQDIREKEGLVYDISSDFYTSWGVGSFAINFESDSTRIDRIMEIIFKDIEEIIKKGFSTKEHEHITKYKNNRTLLNFSTPWSINQWMLDYIFDGEEVMFPENLIDIANTIKEKDVHDVINKIFNFEKMNIVLMGKLEGYDINKTLERVSFYKKKQVGSKSKFKEQLAA